MSYRLYKNTDKNQINSYVIYILCSISSFYKTSLKKYCIYYNSNLWTQLIVYNECLSIYLFCISICIHKLFSYFFQNYNFYFFTTDAVWFPFSSLIILYRMKQSFSRHTRVYVANPEIRRENGDTRTLDPF